MTVFDSISEAVMLTFLHLLRINGNCENMVMAENFNVKFCAYFCIFIDSVLWAFSYSGLFLFNGVSKRMFL